MALGKWTLDLTDRVDEIEERLSEIKDEQESLQQDLSEEMADSGVEQMEDLPAWSSYENEWDDLDAEQTELTGELRKIKETCVDWTTDVNVDNVRSGHDDMSEYWEEISGYYEEKVNSVSFKVRELTFGQLQRVSDDMMEESFEVDVQTEDIEGTPRQGFYQTELLKEAIESWPEGAPTTKEFRVEQPQPGDYPIPVAEWLFERVDAINTTGDTEMGNSSLKEAMKSE